MSTRAHPARTACRAALVTVLLGASVASCGSNEPHPFADGPAGMTFAASCGKDDCDGDGSPASVDCNDSNPSVGPESYDFVGDKIDNDCSGAIDDPIETCETIPTASPGTPTDFARAADLCAQRARTTSGAPYDPLIRAEWGKVSGYGPTQRIWISRTKPQQVGLVSSFGKNAPRRGRTMFGLSNGPWGTPTPRDSEPLDEPDFRLNDACKDIPLTGKDCLSLSDGASAGGLSVQDWAELTLWVKVPRNAQAMVFDFAFFSTEFNQFWKTALNDAFFVLVADGATPSRNVATDPSGLAITLNSSFFQLCPKAPGPPGLSADKIAALATCVGIDGDPKKQVEGSLRGTYYDGTGAPGGNGTATSTDGTKTYVYGGGTGWLTAKFPVTPGGEISVRVIVHDTFDGRKDSAALVDAIRWEPTKSEGVGRPIR